MRPFEVDRLLADISRLERLTATAVDRVTADQRMIKQHRKMLRRLRMRAGLIARGASDYRRPWVTEDGVEWITFSNAVKYGAKLEGDGWHFLFGKHRDTVADDATFFFSVDLDRNARTLLRRYVDTAEFRERGKEVFCSDVKGVLAIAQLVKAPSRIYLRATTRDGVSRVYNVKSTANIRFARVIGGEHAGQRQTAAEEGRVQRRLRPKDPGKHKGYRQKVF